MNEETPDRALQATERSDSSRRRARYRRLFEDCWAPVRTVVEAQLLTALIETLGPLAKSLDEADSKRVKAVLARDRAFVQAYLEALHPELIASIGSFVEAGGSEGAGARALSLIGMRIRSSTRPSINARRACATRSIPNSRRSSYG